ncbi:ferritin-like domain-containing protein [Aestuariibius sp. 2305UL40-4]|uniref:YciE/YciF ferroxidase family protein n=1 Tax=Aestuariibius violaceus TaxID=3234132 RepID=UPI00345E4C9A
MAMNSLKDVYLDQLQDLYSACKQSAPITADMAKAASDKDLAAALKAGVDGIETGMRDIAELCERHGIDPDGEFCKGTEGLVKEARAHAIEADFSDDDARDAMIISQYQRLAHYAIAGYGTLLAFSKRLGQSQDIPVLERCLDSAYEGDRTMTEIATRTVNAAAAA